MVTGLSVGYDVTDTAQCTILERCGIKVIQPSWTMESCKTGKYG